MYLAPYVTEEMQNAKYWTDKIAPSQYSVVGIKKVYFNANGICVKNGKLWTTRHMDEINSTVLIGDAAYIEDYDKNICRVTTPYATGYMYVDNVAFCENYMWKNDKERILVTADGVVLDKNTTNPRISNLLLTMGSSLEEVFKNEAYVNSEGRLIMNAYIVKIPYRKNDGTASYDYGYIPVSAPAVRGAMEYSRENVIICAFRCLGDRYGWGGMYGARDCSSFVMDVFRCFGIVLPRNSYMQSLSGRRVYDVSKMSCEEKEKVIEKAGPGALIYFPGHISIYIGSENNRLYVISAVGNMDGMITGSVVINTLNVRRMDQSTWLSNVCRVTVV